MTAFIFLMQVIIPFPVFASEFVPVEELSFEGPTTDALAVPTPEPLTMTTPTPFVSFVGRTIDFLQDDNPLSHVTTSDAPDTTTVHSLSYTNNQTTERVDRVRASFDDLLLTDPRPRLSHDAPLTTTKAASTTTIDVLRRGALTEDRQDYTFVSAFNHRNNVEVNRVSTFSPQYDIVAAMPYVIDMHPSLEAYSFDKLTVNPDRIRYFSLELEDRIEQTFKGTFNHGSDEGVNPATTLLNYENLADMSGSVDLHPYYEAYGDGDAHINPEWTTGLLIELVDVDGDLTQYRLSDSDPLRDLLTPPTVDEFATRDIDPSDYVIGPTPGITWLDPEDLPVPAHIISMMEQDPFQSEEGCSGICVSVTPIQKAYLPPPPKERPSAYVPLNDFDDGRDKDRAEEELVTQRELFKVKLLPDVAKLYAIQHVERKPNQSKPSAILDFTVLQQIIDHLKKALSQDSQDFHINLRAYYDQLMDVASQINGANPMLVEKIKSLLERVRSEQPSNEDKVDVKEIEWMDQMDRMTEKITKVQTDPVLSPEARDAASTFVRSQTALYKTHAEPIARRFTRQTDSFLSRSMDHFRSLLPKGRNLYLRDQGSVLEVVFQPPAQ